MEFNFNTTGRWLEVTEQQFEILKTIYRLGAAGQKTTPQNIGKEYTKTYGKIIQKPNLFTIFKILSEKNLIIKQGQANYQASFEGIRAALAKHKQKIEEEQREFAKIYEQTEEYFKKNVIKPARPQVEYLDHNQLFDKIVERLNVSHAYHVVANFPTIAYTHQLAEGVGRRNYVEVLWKKCFTEKQLQVNILTDLDVDYLFNHALRINTDPKLAYSECEIVLAQLAKQTQAHEKLDIRYLPDPHGLDVAIPESAEPQEFFLFTRDEHKDISGGVHIKSPDTASSAKHMFTRGYEYAEKIRENPRLIEDARTKLDEKYGILKG